MNENCPLCNSINTNKSREGFTFKKNAGENYLKSIKNYRHELLEKKINFYICRDCGTGWRDDSNFSKKIDEIYHKQHSLHWKSFLVFRELVIGNISSSHLISMEKLVKLYSNFLNKPLSILEIGSPILGFGFQFSDFNKIKYIQSHNRKVTNLDFLLFIQERLTFIQIITYKSINNIKKLIKKILGIKKTNPKIIFNKFKSIKYYELPTTIGWGSSSIICGHSTTKWLLFLNSKVGITNKYKEKGAMSDLTICVNYLDHLDNPVEIIKEILLISKLFIFNIHKQHSAAPQHKYTYANNFDQTITKLLDNNYLCLRISNEIFQLFDQEHYNYFIVGEQNLTKKYINFLKKNNF